MKIQIYAGVLCFVWMIATARLFAEAAQLYSSYLEGKGWMIMTLGFAVSPLIGRVWGWW